MTSLALSGAGPTATSASLTLTDIMPHVRLQRHAAGVTEMSVAQRTRGTPVIFRHHGGVNLAGTSLTERAQAPAGAS